MKTIKALLRSTCMFAVLVLAGPVSASPYKEIRDTSVFCSNSLACTIMLKAKAEYQGVYSFSLSRAAGPDTPILIKLNTSEPFAEGSDVVVLLDGAEAARFGLADLDRNPDMGEYIAKDKNRGRALLSLMRDSSDLTVEFVSTVPKKASFSMAGLAGAMLFLDEAQDRIGTVDAVEKIGDKPSPEAKVRDVTDMTTLPEKIRQDFELPDAVCGFTDPDRFKYGQGFAASLGDNTEMYVLPCAEGGAYNQPYAIYEVTGDFIERVHLAIMTDDGPSTTPDAFNVDWDQSAKTLTAFYKGRGIGDCGSLDTWGLRDIDGDVSLVLKESRLKDECDGVGTPAEEWPLMWPVK